MTTIALELKQELDRLLDETVDEARQREATTFDKMAGSSMTNLVLFGAGNLGRRTLTGLRRIGIEPLCFVDNNKALWDHSLDGLPVYSPEMGAKLYGSVATFVVTIWRGEGTDRMSARIQQLRDLGCKSYTPFLPLYWKYSDSFLPHYLQDLPHRVLMQADRVRAAFCLMADDESRLEYLAQVRYRLLGDFDCLPNPVDGAIYFRKDLFSLMKDESLVDCGAFDGDTISLFLEATGNSFMYAFAFEPDPANYARLLDRIGKMPPEVRERVALHQAATGDANVRLLMDVGNGAASHLGGGDLEVECVALDSFLREVAVTFLKMDIEGSELATLAGAQNLIRKNCPILAICSYHKQDDLWNIPLYIQGLNPDYSLYLRPHLLEGWDLVCYAVPSKRRC
jgi:FkbM family methyltransferase